MCYQIEDISVSDQGNKSAILVVLATGVRSIDPEFSVVSNLANGIHLMDRGSNIVATMATGILLIDHDFDCTFKNVEVQIPSIRLHRSRDMILRDAQIAPPTANSEVFNRLNGIHTEGIRVDSL